MRPDLQILLIEDDPPKEASVKARLSEHLNSAGLGVKFTVARTYEEALRALVPETAFQPPGEAKFSASMKTVAAPIAPRFAKRMSRPRQRDFMRRENPPGGVVLENWLPWRA